MVERARPNQHEALGVGGSEGAHGRGADAVARRAHHVRDQPVAERGGGRARLGDPIERVERRRVRVTRVLREGRGEP